MSVSTAQALALLGATDYARLFAGLPTAYLVLTPDLTIADANDAYLQLLGRNRQELIGRGVFEAFPPTPDALDDQGRNPLQLSFERARDTGRSDTMPLHSYAVFDPTRNQTVQRYWSLIHAPLLNVDGSTRLILQRVEDVTDYVEEREGRRAAVEQGQAWQRRVELVEADLYTRARELAAEVAAKDLLTHRLAALADVALELAAAETTDDLEHVVVSRGLSVLGAAGGAIISPETSGWRVTASSLGAHVELTYGHLPYDSPLPAIEVARTGHRLLLPTRSSGFAFHPAMAQVYADTRSNGWAFLPLMARGLCLGSLAVAWTEEHQPSGDELNLLDGFAAQCAQALDRIRATAAQQQAMLSAQRMSSTLQRSMLINPSLPHALDVAVRYQPASSEAQVGGDWYDAFTTATGATTLVIGDVHGHDQDAAAAMGQIRNLLRGMAYHGNHGPAELLTGLDTALDGLEVAALATALICRMSIDSIGPTGSVSMRWSNAGHLPPLLRDSDGTVHILDSEPDLLLGVDAGTPRTEHGIELPPGSTLLLYTDGLVERRDTSLDAGIAELAATLASEGGVEPNEVCTRLLAGIDTQNNEDDIAILALRVRER